MVDNNLLEKPCEKRVQRNKIIWNDQPWSYSFQLHVDYISLLPHIKDRAEDRVAHLKIMGVYNTQPAGIFEENILKIVSLKLCNIKPCISARMQNLCVLCFFQIPKHVRVRLVPIMSLFSNKLIIIVLKIRDYCIQIFARWERCRM